MTSSTASSLLSLFHPVNPPSSATTHLVKLPQQRRVLHHREGRSEDDWFVDDRLQSDRLSGHEDCQALDGSVARGESLRAQVEVERVVVGGGVRGCIEIGAVGK